MHLNRFFLLIFLGLFLFSCDSDVQTTDEDSIEVQEGPQQVDESEILEPEPEPIPVTYHLLCVKDTLDWLMQLPAEHLDNILLINRLNKSYLAKRDSVVVPDTLVADKNWYCPFPNRIDSLKEINKIVYVSRFAQAFVAYENGQRMNWGPVSTGKSTTQTPNGLFSTNWKSKQNTSSVNSSWILNWYFNIANYEGIAFHEYALPGVAASHGCIRMYADDAKWLYDWANQWILDDSLKILANGTPVIVFDQYPYNERRPWWYLPENNLYLTKNASQMMQVYYPYRDKILDRQTVYQKEKELREIRKMAKDSLISSLK